jgi:Flp pilus assembly protein TadD
VSLFDASDRSEHETVAGTQDALRRASTWHAQQARACERDKHWFGAAFHWNQLASLEPHNWRHLERRGNAYIGLEEWDKATTAFDQAAALGAGARMEYNRAVLGLRANDEQSYRAICVSLLAAFSETEDGPTANTVAWICSLSAASAVDRDRVVLLAEQAVAHRRTNTYLNTLGAALHRAGRHQDAVKVLAETIEAHGRGGTAHDWLFLAMAHHALGRTDDARLWFHKAAQWIDQAVEQQASGSPVDPSFTWSSQIELHVLRREAEELFGTKGSVPAPPRE